MRRILALLLAAAAAVALAACQPATSTRQNCTDALDEADRLFVLHSEVHSITADDVIPAVQDALEALLAGSGSAMRRATTEIDAATARVAEIAVEVEESDYDALAAACRGEN